MIYIEFYAVLLLAKLVPIYAILCVGFLAQKSGRVNLLTNFMSGGGVFLKKKTPPRFVWNTPHSLF